MGMVEYIVLGEHREGDRRFNDIDLAFFKSEAGLAKVKRSFENSPYDFRFIVALGAQICLYSFGNRVVGI
jgi:hypothetical protein